MDITWGTAGSYNITDRNMPDFPIVESEINGGDYLRGDSGVLYNPSKYRLKAYSFTFSNVQSGLLDQFVDLFKDEAYFTIADADFGTVTVLPVPGSLSCSYLTKGNCNLTFAVQTQEAL